MLLYAYSMGRVHEHAKSVSTIAGAVRSTVAGHTEETRKQREADWASLSSEDRARERQFHLAHTPLMERLHERVLNPLYWVGFTFSQVRPLRNMILQGNANERLYNAATQTSEKPSLLSRIKRDLPFMAEYRMVDALLGGALYPEIKLPPISYYQERRYRSGDFTGRIHVDGRRRAVGDLIAALPGISVGVGEKISKWLFDTSVTQASEKWLAKHKPEAYVRRQVGLEQAENEIRKWNAIIQQERIDNRLLRRVGGRLVGRQAPNRRA